MDTPPGWAKFYVSIDPRYDDQPHPRLRMGGSDICWFLIANSDTHDPQHLHQLALDELEGGYQIPRDLITVLYPEDTPPADHNQARHVYPIEQVLYPTNILREPGTGGTAKED